MSFLWTCVLDRSWTVRQLGHGTRSSLKGLIEKAARVPGSRIFPRDIWEALEALEKQKDAGLQPDLEDVDGLFPQTTLLTPRANFTATGLGTPCSM